MDLSYLGTYINLTHSFLFGLLRQDSGLYMMVLSAWLALSNKLVDPNDKIYDVEALEKRRCNVENNWLSY